MGILIVGEDFPQLLRIYPVTTILSLFCILPAVIWGKEKNPLMATIPHRDTITQQNSIKIIFPLRQFMVYHDAG